MDETLVIQLKNLNNKFYSEVAVEFDKSREYPWQGWKKLVADILPKTKSIYKVLDIACGNARFARYLSEFYSKLEYFGIDFSKELISAAQNKLNDTNIDYKLLNTDVLSEWEKDIDKKFDLVVCFGIFHHIPGIKNRKKLIKKAISMLDKDGILIITVWQFPKFKRFEKKVVPKEVILKRLKIDPEKLETNGYILDWQRGKTGYRYSHYMSDEEFLGIINGYNLEIIFSFESDGKSENINKYFVLKFKK